MASLDMLPDAAIQYMIDQEDDAASADLSDDAEMTSVDLPPCTCRSSARCPGCMRLL